MSYRNQIYVCFGGDEDMNHYRTLQMWDANKKIDFNFNNAHNLTNIRVFEEENIKRNLRERMNNTKMMIVLVGEKTRNLYKYVRWEIELALEKDIPIIVANLNGKNGIDNNLCPPILKGKVIVHVPFRQKAIIYALDNWYQSYASSKASNKSDFFWECLNNI